MAQALFRSVLDMDPPTMAVLSSIYKAATVVKNLSHQANENKHQCRRLSDRVEAISDALKTIPAAVHERAETKRSLQHLKKTVEDSCDLVGKFTGTRQTVRLREKTDYQSEFEAFSNQLSNHANDLNLTVNISVLFNIRQDLADQKADNDDILATVEDTSPEIDDMSSKIAAFMLKFNENEYEISGQYAGSVNELHEESDSTKLRLQQYGISDISSESDSLSKRLTFPPGTRDSDDKFNKSVTENIAVNVHTKTQQSPDSTIRMNILYPLTKYSSYSNLKLVKRIDQFESGTRIDLFKQQLTDRDMPIVVEEAMIKKQCIGLNLYDNQITSQGASILADALRNNTPLVKLYLKDNCLLDMGAYYLSNSLSRHNSTLKRLSLHSNGITDVGAQYLADMLKENRTLTELWLSSNKIGNEGVKMFANTLAHHNTSLTQLVLSSNKLVTDSSVEYLMTMLKHNQTLMELWIDNCNLSARGLAQLQHAAKSKRDFTLYVETDLSFV